MLVHAQHLIFLTDWLLMIFEENPSVIIVTELLRKIFCMNFGNLSVALKSIKAFVIKRFLPNIIDPVF